MMHAHTLCLVLGAAVLCCAIGRGPSAGSRRPVLAPSNQLLLCLLRSCEPTQIDGHWDREASLSEIHRFEVSQHEACEVRVTVLNETASGQHKVGSGVGLRPIKS